MSNFAAVIKSLIGQVFVTSVDGIRRQVFEGDRIFAGEQVTTADGGSVTLEMANGETVKLGANASWQAGNPDAQEVADSASQAPVSEFEQALAAGMDPTVDLDPTAAGPGAGGGGGSAGGGHSAVMLSETAQRVDPTIGFQTTGLGTPGFNLIEDNDPAIFATADAADTGTTTPDTTAPVVTIGIDPITGDDILNSAELGATTVTITGTVGGEAKVGDAITLNLGGNVYNGTVIALGNGALGFSIPVSSADLSSFNSISATVSSSDAAGNVGTATASRPYTVDTTAPVITVDAPAITNDTTPTIVGTTDAPVGSTVTLTITQGTTVLTTTATVVAGGTYSADIPAGLVEGPYSVDAKVTDAAGNIGSATDTGAIDTTAPVPTISLDANITADDVINSTEATQQIPVTGTVGGDAKVGDTVTLTVNGKQFTGQVQADKTFSINVPGSDLVADAGKTINASISTTDAAGNIGTATDTEGYSVNTTLPVPTITLDANITADDVINSTEATQQIPVTGTVGGDAKVGDTVTLTVNGKQFTGQVQADKTFSINVPGSDLVADAGKTINASISTTDAAGNVGSAATSEGYSVDVTAPVPTISLDANITPDDVINSTEAGQQIPVTGTVGGDAKVGDTVTLTVNGKTFTGQVQADKTFSINVPGADLIADAGKTINASISTTDAAGNIGTATDSEGYSVNTTLPVPTISLDANITADDVINSTEATQQIPVTGTVGGDAKVGDTVTLTVNGKTFTGQVQADKTFSINVPGADLVADAGKTINASISTTDAAGNLGSAATSEGYSVDVTAPVPTISLDANITADDVINSTEATQQIPVTGTVGGDAKVGDTVTLTVNGKTFTGQVQADKTFSINIPGADLVADAGKTINASISTTDAAGNVGSAATSEGYSVDVTAPAITVDAPAVTNDTTPTIVGTTDAPVGSIVTLTVTQGSTVITVTTPVLAGGTYSVELNQPLAEGPYSVDAKVTDAAGNTGSATDTGAIDTTAPVITVDAPAITNDTTPSIVGTTDAPIGSVVTLTITQGTTVLTTTATVVAGGTYSADVPAGLVEGPYSVDAKVTDAADNTGSATDTGAIDTTAPVITVDAPAITNDTTPTIVGTTDAPVGSTVTLTITQGTTVLTTTATVVAGGTYSADVPAGLVEGPYSVDAKVTDAAGNIGSATDTGAINTTAPVITVDAPAITNDTTPTIVGTTDAPVGSTVTLTITQGTTVLTTTATVVAGGTYSADVTAGLAEGPYSVDAKVTDAAGNTGSATDTGAIDTTAPVITVDAPAITNDTTPTIVGTTDAPVGSTVTLTITQGTTVLTTTATVVAGGTYSADVPAALVEGPYSVDAKVTDAAGNTGSATDTGAIDTTAPVITVDAPAITNDTTPTIVGTTDAPVGSTVTLTITQGTTVLTTTATVVAGGTYSADVTAGLAEGPYSVDAKVTDAAGNTGSATDTGAIDTTAPVITVDAPAITNDTTPTIVGTTDAPVGSTVTLTITQGTTVLTTTATVVAGGTYSADVPAGLVEGPYSVDAKVTDPAGNTGSATDSGAIDTTAPVITVDAPAVTNDTTPTIVGTTDAPVGSTVTLTITQGTTVLTTTATVVAGGTYSADVPAGLVEGPYSVDAKVTDAAGNTGSATDTGAIDTTAPVITVDAPAVTNDTTPTIVGTTDAPAGSIVTLTVTQGSTVITVTTPVLANGTYSVELNQPLAEGPYSVDAKVTDAAGNTGSATDTGAIDTTAPVITVDAPAITNDTTPTIVGTTDAPVGSIVTLTVTQGSTVITVTTPVLAGGTYSVELNQPLAEGPYSVDAKVTDAAGNTGSATDTGAIDTTAPVITVDAPAITNDTTPTITGTTDAPVGSTVTLTITQGTTVLTTTATVVAGGTYSADVPAGLVEGPYSVDAKVTDAAGNTGSATDTGAIDTTAPAPTISLDANITSDDVINSTEATQQIPVTGTVGGDAKVGDTVTLTVNGKQFTGLVTDTNGTLGFSINVPGADLVADAGKTINASISTTDAAGNLGSAATSEGYSVDVTAPVPTITLDANITPDDVINSTEAGQQIPVTGTVGGDAKVGDTVTLTVNGKQFTGQVQADKTFSINVPGADLVADAGKTINSSISTTDAAGNIGTATDTEGYSVNTTLPVPTISLDANITADDVINSTEAGQQIPVTGTVGGDAKVGDTVTLTVNGKQFTGQVQADKSFSINVPGADLVADAGKTINASISTTDAAGNVGSAATSEGYSVDVTAPVPTISLDANITADDVINSTEAGQQIPVTGTVGGDAKVGDNVTLTVNGKTFAGQVQADKTFSINVPGADLVADAGKTINASISTTDAAGNIGTATDTEGYSVNTTLPVPTISLDANITADDVINSTEAGQQIPVTGTVGGDAKVGDTVTLTVNGKQFTGQVQADKSFSINVPGADLVADAGKTINASISTTDAAGNVGSAATSEGYSVDVTAPVPTISLDANITADDVINSTEATQQIPVTGTVGGDAKVGDTVTLTVNGKTFTGQVHADKTFSINVPGADLVADAGKTINASISTTDAVGNVGSAATSEGYSVDVTAPVPTISLDANITADDVVNSTEATQQIPVTGTVGGDAKVGDTVTLSVNGKTFTGSVVANPNGTLGFSINVPGADLVADAGKTINASISTTDAAGNIGTATDSEGYSVDITAPVPTISLDANITADDVINIAESTQQIPVTGTVGGDAKVGDTVTLTVNGKQFTGQVLADKTFSINVPGADLVADAGKTINASISTTDAAGNVGSAATSEGYSVDVTAPVPTISLDANITADDVINSTEATQQIPVTGTVGGDAKVGDTVTLSVNGKQFTGQVQADKTFSINVPGTDLVADAGKTINASISTTDAAGNIGTATDSEGYSVDVTPPSAAIDIVKISEDTGTPGDFVTRDNTLTVSGTVGPLASGEKAQISVDGGNTWTDLNVNNGTWDYTDGRTLSLGDHTYQVRVVDAAGNLGSTDTQKVTIIANQNPVAVNDPGTAAGLTGQYYAYHEGTNLDGPNLSSLAQVRAFIDANSPDASFVAKNINYSLGGGDLGGNNNLQTFLGSDAASLNVDPENSSDAIIKLSGTLQLQAGSYQFQVRADDGYSISIDGVIVSRFDGNQSPSTNSGSFTISEPGAHTIEIIYWDQGGQAALQPTLSFAGGAYQPLSNFSPTQANPALVTGHDNALTISQATLLANDSDADGDTLRIVGVDNPKHGTVTLNDNGTITFTPASNYYGPASFSYTVSDGNGGTSTATVTVNVTGDAAPSIGAVSNAVDSSGNQVDEGDNAVFTVNLSNASITSTTFSLSLNAGTAKAGSDYNGTLTNQSFSNGVTYNAANGTVTVPAGVSSFTVTVPTINDTISEPTETFSLTVGGKSGTATIIDNDGVPTVSAVSSAVDSTGGQVDEGDNAVFTVNLTNAGSTPTTFSLALNAGTATAGSDYNGTLTSQSFSNGVTYNAANGTVTVPAGVTSFTVTVPTINDTVAESTETFSLSVGGKTGTATIIDNDPVPTVSTVSSAVDSTGGQVDEGDNAVFTVNLTNASSTATTFSLALNAGTAAAGSDYNGTLTNQSFSNGVTYNAANGTVTVPAGVTSFTVTVPTVDDTVFEPAETFSLTVGGKTGTATIVDNDAAPTIGTVSAAVDSGGGQVDEGDNAVFTVNLTNASSTPTTFSLTLNAGTATAGSDYNGTLTNQSFSNGVTYNAANGTVTVPAGVTSFTVTVPTVDDTVSEPTETFSLTVGGKTGTATIIDNDAAPTIGTVSAAVDSSGGQVDEGDNAVFTVNLTNASSTPTTFSLALNAGTATPGSDYNGTLTNQSFSNGVTYNAANGTVTVPAGVTSFTVTVPTIDDTVSEPTENFTLTVGGKTGTATIVDNDAAPTVGSVSSAVDSSGGQVDEGDNAVFTVNLTNASSTATTFSLALNAGTATAGTDYNGTLTNQSFSNGVTYNAANGTVTVPAGITSFTVTVPTINDTVYEQTETFTLNVGGKAGTATIIDNDPVPTVSTVSSAVDSNGGQVDEGDNAVFTVNLTNASSTPTTFSLTLNAGTATAGSDYNGTLTNQSFSNGVTYNPANGTVTVPAGVTSFTVTVPTINDTVYEQTENFTLTVGGKTGTATIVDNDAAPTIGTVSAAVDSSGGQVDEGDNAVFTVNLTNASSTATTFSLALNAGTATAGSDYNGTLTNQSFSNGVTYNAANGTVTVPAGVTSFTVTVPTIDDTVFEPTENFTLTVGGKTGTATIIDNDAAPTVGSVSSAVDSNGGQVDEGDNAVFTVNLTNASSTPTTFSLALNAGTATAGSDYNGTLTSQNFSNGVTYNAANGTVTVPAGVTSFTVTVPTIDDTVFEPAENFTLTVGGKTGTATIVDNDAAPTVGSVSSAVDSSGGQVDEGDNAVFTVNLTNASSTATTFSLALNAGTATAGSDYNGTLTNQSFSNGVTYNAATGQVTVPAGITSFTVTVPTVDDTVFEPAENFTLTIGGKTGTATIIDNDAAPTVGSVSSAVDSNGGQVDEGDNAVFTVNLTNASSTPTTFSLALNAGTATAGSDYNGTLTSQSFSNGVAYNAANGTVTVPAGVTSFTVTVQTINDTVYEQTETFTLNVGGKVGTATIIDNDPVPTVSTVSSAVDSSGGQVDEGDNAVFTVNLTNASSTPTTFSLALNAGTAIAGSDYNGTLTNQSFSNGVTYNAANGTVTVPAGVTSFTVTVPTINDTVYEQTESFTLNVGGKVGTATIIDNDPVPTVKTIDVGQPGTADDNVIEGNNLVFNVTLSNASSTPTVLSFNATGTATANVDYKLNAQSFSNGVTYDANTGKITVPAGVTSFSVTVQTLADNVVGEPLETVKLDIGGQSATGGIIDGTPDAKDDSYTKVTGLKAEYFGYREGTGAGNDGANLTNLSQVRQFIDTHKAAATFNATTLDYGNLSNATGLGNGTNLQAFLGVNTTTGNGAKANSLSTDPGDTSDAIIKMSGYINLAAGTYQFRVTADDGYSIRINGQVVAEFNNIQSSATATGKSFTIGAANAGPQQIEIIYWDQGGDARLKVEVGQGGNFKVVDSDMLYHVPTTSTLTMDAGDSLTIASSTLLSNDTDPNNDSLSITSVQNATNGTVTLNNGNVVFTPKSGFYGDASFQYTISDGKGGSDTATVTLKVNQAANVIHVAGDGANDNGNNTINGGAGSDVLLGDAGGTLTTLQPATNYNIALLVDTSGSMQGDRMSLTKTALSNFVKTLAGHDGVVNVTLVGFAEKVTLSAKVEDLQSGTSLDALLANIQKLTASGGTNYEAAFKEASAWFDAQSTAGHTKAAGYENLTFFLSDGDPTYYYNGNTTTLSGNGSTTNNEVLLGSLDTFNVLAGKSSVQAIGIGSGVSEKNLSLYDNTTDTPASTYLANGSQAVLASFNNSTSGWNNLTNWETSGTGGGSSVSRSSDTLVIRDTWGGTPVTAATPTLTIADGSFSSLKFAYGTTDTSNGDSLTWKLQQLVNGAWTDVQTGGGTTGGNWTSVETSVVGAGTYRLEFSVDDKSFNLNSASMSIDNITRVDYTKVPVGKVEIVNSADELSVALHGGANANVPVSVGNDTIFGGDGNDIIFGDVINTDALPWGVNGNPAKPADMYNGSGVKALETFLELKNGVAPTNADLYDYIRANHDTFNVAGDTRGGADKLYGGNGNDILYGQGGNDLLVGGAGDDILFGGAGADTFAWQKGDFGKDVIKDFNVAEGDTIDLSSLLQDHSNNLDSYLKLVTDNGSSTLLISTKGEFNNADTTTQQVAAKADVQIDLGQASLPSYDINTLIANHTIKVDP